MTTTRYIVAAVAMLYIVACLSLFVAGCSTPDAVPQRYMVRLIRPDGTVHSERVVESTQKPRKHLLAGGIVSVVGHGYAPVGWLYEIDGPLGEVERP